MATIDVAMESTCQEILNNQKIQMSDTVVKSAGTGTIKYNTVTNAVSITGSGYVLGVVAEFFKQTSDSTAYATLVIDGNEVLALKFTGTSNGGTCYLYMVCPDILMGNYMVTAGGSKSISTGYTLYEKPYGQIVSVTSSGGRIFMSKNGLRFNSSVVLKVYCADASKTNNYSGPNYVTYCLDD